MLDNKCILVVGAGPTGLTMACELARRSVPVRIIDKLPGIIPYCRATGIHSRTLEIFQDMGIIEPVLEEGIQIRAASQYANGKRFQHLSFGQVDSPYPYTIGLEQYRTEALLEALLNRLGVFVERDTELVAVQECLQGVGVTLKHANGQVEQFHTPWLLACDGAHSQVRHLNRQRFPGETDLRQYFVADVITTPAYANDEMHLFLSDHGTLFLFPLPGERSLLISDVPEQHDHTAEKPEIGDIQQRMQDCGLENIKVSEARWLSYFRINYRITRHYQHGRTFLAGDAAHIHSPIGAQGMNTGIQDAYNLAWKLALVYHGHAAKNLLKSYEKERHAVAEDVLETTRHATEHAEAFSGLSNNEREKLFFNAALPEVERIRSIQHREELDLDYRKSPICCENFDRHAQTILPGPLAGAEAPEAGPIRVNKHVMTLFHLFRGIKHTLFLFAGETGTGEARGKLIDLAGQIVQCYGNLISVYWVEQGDASYGAIEHKAGIFTVFDMEGEMHRRYGVSNETLYLIRPDGYIAYRSSPVKLRELRDYLDSVFTLHL